MDPERDKTKKPEWPESVFSHIEPGESNPILGEILGYAGLIIGIFPALLLVFQAGYSILVKQILDPGIAVLVRLYGLESQWASRRCSINLRMN